MTVPSFEQMQHLIGHASSRVLTPDESAALRAGVRALQEWSETASSGPLGAHGSMVGRTMSGYLAQLKQQLAAAKEELALWRRRRAREAELEEQLAEARMWARHGYQGCPDMCRWTTHQDAPTWLTEES